MKCPRVKSIATLALLAAASLTRAASPVDDNFDDGVRGPQWQLVQDNPANLSLLESGGTLNIISTGGGAATDDALYLSNFRLSTAADFSITIDYALSPTGPSGNGSSGDALGVVFGVGRDFVAGDPSMQGTDSAAIGAGFANGGIITAAASTIAYRIDDVQTTGNSELFSPITGTFAIDYVSATDDLTLRRVGSTFSFTLPTGTVRGVWGADDLYVSLGGRGSGLAATSGQITLDNFSVVNGSVVPEPTGLAALAAATLMLRRRRA